MKHKIHLTITVLLLIAVIGLIADRYTQSNLDRNSTVSLAIIPIVPVDDVPMGVAEFVSHELYENFGLNSDFELTERSKVVDAIGPYQYPEHLGRLLDVQYVLEGAVYKRPDAYMVLVQLIESETADHVWTKKYHSSQADLSVIVANIESDIRRWTYQ